MPEFDSSYLLSSLLFASLYVTGIILAAAYWQRSPTSCLLVLVGSVVNLLMTLLRVRTFFFKFDWDFDAVGAVFDLGLSVGQIVGHALWLTAALMVHAPAPVKRPGGNDDWDPTVAPRLRVGPGNTGIQGKP